MKIIRRILDFFRLETGSATVEKPPEVRVSIPAPAVSSRTYGSPLTAEQAIAAAAMSTASFAANNTAETPFRQDETMRPTHRPILSHDMDAWPHNGLHDDRGWYSNISGWRDRPPA